MTDIERLVALMNADGLNVTPEQAEAIALEDHESVAAFIEYYESLQLPDIEAGPETVSEKFKEPTVMEVL